ncbi:type I glyceraldehyde-3-phosphate dehydrogenase [Candidatus Kaiserbacteria bacterium CG10_big_fil_rev_8_21_14_0_10_49_17]|uniref:Type I glyceraldehyde-3-phosphate dehydrogenase n=1 Tax=Candidatus Kaiserbacteria bacterium CG10_big_fil_rev_8_21_14_0_10_49_17 TaxID=1974609 RepID=A0A2M6WEZ4_9BACT|nr:MAG: type I glyceraldehyde-3-phosphate dehydrogenase [Candidatus Kaiserbacteria bacterium CG10_big_fil_rev_8_21_14_0_10_49_17]
MEKVKVAINGFGRIGRAFFKLAVFRKDIEIVAINDLGNIDNLAYLLKYDSVYGPSGLSVEVHDEALVVEGRTIQFISEPDPAKLPWKALHVDVALEATGVFASFQKAKAHLDAGAKRVVISAPVKDVPPEGITGETVLLGVNEEKLKTCDISSNASCTTNAGSPLVQILKEKIGIEKAVLNTVHGYTASQSIVDGPSKKDPRRGRAGAINIIPSTTGAATATTKAITDLDGKFDGMAMRVPVPVGSLVDVTFIASRDTSVEEVNTVLKSAAESKQWQGVFSVTEDPIVSTDIIGSRFASIADLNFTRVIDGNLVKVLAWYDNEMGYTSTLVEHVVKSGQYGTGLA